MTVELLQTMSLVGYIMSGILLFITIVLFFVLKVPAVIGDLSGATARKAIEDIRQQTENNASGVASNIDMSVSRSTDKIGTQKLSEETAVLTTEGSSETTLLFEHVNVESSALCIELDMGFWESNEWID